MTRKQREAAETRIRHAMGSLVGNPEFAQFINLLRDHREIVVGDACSDTVVNSQRASMAAIGEIRAYTSIIAMYDEYVSRAADEAEREQVQE